MTRKWFQIHLSTALVLMFVAGGFLWLNFKDFYSAHSGYVAEVRHIGWPIRVHGNFETTGSLMFDFQDYSDDATLNRLLFNTFGTSTKGIASISWGIYEYEHFKWWVLPNTLVAIFLLIFSAVVSEYLIRRREAIR